MIIASVPLPEVLLVLRNRGTSNLSGALLLLELSKDYREKHLPVLEAIPILDLTISVFLDFH